MRKLTKITVSILGGLVLVILILWLLLQYRPIQNKLVKIATDKASAITGASIKIGSVDFSLFNRFYLNEILVRDKQKDTVLYAGALQLKITDWFFLKDEVTIQYLGLENAIIHTKRKDSIWNYEFLFSKASTANDSSSATGTKIPKLDLKNLTLKNISYISRDMWRGEDQFLRIGHLILNANEIDLDQKKILIDKVVIENPNFQIRQYQGFRPDSLRPKTPPRIKGQLYWNPEQWNIAANNIEIKDGVFASDLNNDKEPLPYFDGAHLLFSEINGNIKGLTFIDDTLKGNLALSTRERSGFQVTSMKAKMKMDPDRMAFSDLTILTPYSRVGNEFAMEYRYFTDDMAAFISNVNMRGVIQNSTLNLKDIAYFAPALNNKDLAIKLSGNVNGSVEKLTANNLRFSYGKKTNLAGNLMISGLPEVQKTKYQFQQTSIQTDAEDLYTLIPSLKEDLKINLKNAGTISFSGNATLDHTRFSTIGMLTTSIGRINSNIQLNNIYESNLVS